MATAECRLGGGLNSSSGGELKLYPKWKRNTGQIIYIDGKTLYIKTTTMPETIKPVL